MSTDQIKYEGGSETDSDPTDTGTLSDAASQVKGKLKKAKLDDEAQDTEYMGIEFEEHNTILNLLKSAQLADHDNRTAAREAHLFVDKRDGQWEPYWWTNNVNRPRYTFDMCNPIIDQITGEIQQADFDVKVSPAGGNANKKIAATIDGIIRNIENISNAGNVYAASARSMVTCGFDAWRVSTKFVDDNSFDQDLVVEPISNVVDRVWFDPSAELETKSDSRYCFVLHPIAAEEYKARWPERAGLSVPTDRDGNAYYDRAETICVGEILYAELEDRTLVLMSNGKVYEDDEDYEALKDELLALGIKEVRRRVRKDRKIISRLFDADDWLEDGRDTVFSSIPVVPVYGNFKVFENKTLYWGVVEKLLDPQRVLNYSLSREIEEGALAPRAKYWMTMAQASGHEQTLRTLNTNADPVQFFNVDPNYQQVPQQQGGAVVNPGLRTISESMRGMIAQTAGMFAANMGDNPNAQSGVAIEALQNKGDNGTYKYFKAIEVAIGATGRLMVDAIPKVYDTQRTIRILKEDGSFDMAELNEQVMDQQTGQIKTLNDLSMGTYDVVCRAGPSFKNRQQETMQFIIDMAKVDESIMPIAGDIILQAVSTPAAAMIAERKRMQMVAQGLIPQSQLTDDEKAEQAQKAQSQQGQQPQDPNMILAQAELVKAQAMQLDAQTNAAKAQSLVMAMQLKQHLDEEKIALQSGANQISAFDSQTKRMDIEVKAQQAGANVNLNTSKAQGQAIDNQIKMKDLQNPYAHLSDEELIRMAMGGQ